MAVQPPNKTLPQDKDIVVSESKVTGNSEPREQLSQVLDNFDLVIQKEIEDRIADVNEEEDRALIAEAYLAKLIEEERDARIASSNGTGLQGSIDQEAQSRTDADGNIIDAINNDRQPLSVTVSLVSPKSVYIEKAWEHRIDPATGDVSGRIVIANGSQISNFAGATINFATGANDAGDSFTPTNFSGYENSYSRYILVLKVNNQIEVIPSLQYHATNPQLAPYPSLATNGILVGSVVVRDNGTGGVGTIADIDPLTITFFKDSMSSGDDAPIINTSPLEIQEDELFTYYTREDFQEDSGALFESTDGTNDLLVNHQIILGVNKTLITKDIVGAQAHEDALYINAAQIKILYKISKTDPSPVVQFSKDGGLTWKTGVTYLPANKGNLVVSDVVFNDSAIIPLLSAPTPSGSTIGTNIAAIIMAPYNLIIDSFSMRVKTLSSTGTVIAKIYEVSAGTPQALISTSAESFACGTDVNSVYQDKRFSFKPFVLKKDSQYALAIEGVGINSALEAYQSSDTVSYNISSSSKNGGGWLASSNKISFKAYGSGYELKVSIKSSIDDSRVAGFGVNYVTDQAFMLNGQASWEDRTVTSTEASTGVINLNQISYTPGVRQLRLNIDGKEYFAPNDFTETSPNQIRLPLSLITTGTVLRFYNTYGLVDTGAIMGAGAVGPVGPAGPTGATGSEGAVGVTGATGATGQGIASGGSAGQVLAKIDATNYNTHWITPSASSGSYNLSYQDDIMVADATELQMGPVSMNAAGILSSVVLVAQENDSNAVVQIVNATQGTTQDFTLTATGQFVRQSFTSSLAYAQNDIIYIRVIQCGFLRNLTVQF